jgi:UDP-glucose 4-epimerase
MRVLVTGGAGYIGSHVVDSLIGRGYEVVVFDNLIAGHRGALHPQATFVQGDLLNIGQIRDAMDRYPVEGIFHFASHIQVGESMKNPFKYLRDNIDGMTNLLEVAMQHRIKRFILSSTANLYDAPQRIPISEEEPLIPGSVYGETKLYSEHALGWMDRIYGMKSCCLRYFNACGAHPNGHIGEDHRPETHLIPLVLQVALGRREKVQIYGTDYETPDGTCIRDYIHVLDLASAHILALEALGDGQSRVYNLGSGTGYSVLEVVETVRRVTGHAIPVEIAARRAGDLAVLVADSAKIKREMGWLPEYDNLQRIIETAWNWHRNHPNGYPD